MARSTATARALRINAARTVLKQASSPADAAAVLARDHGISLRQAYRDLELAGRLSAPMPVPDPKVTLTVKLPERLVAAMRAQARRHKMTLSGAVSRAIESWLRGDRGGAG